jgi:hypothetical protein
MLIGILGYAGLLVSRKLSGSLLVRWRQRGALRLILGRVGGRKQTTSVLVASRILGSFLRIRHRIRVCKAVGVVVVRLRLRVNGGVASCQV